MIQEVAQNRSRAVLRSRNPSSMMLVQALRLHLAEGLRDGVGWLFARADKQMSAAIGSIHGNPAHRLTFQELARRAGMSKIYPLP
jgi:hypothetical protein